MISEATARFQRISPRKARVIINLVRGRDAAEALQLLDYTPKSGAPIVKKLIASALANAQQKNPSVDSDALFISKATVDKGPDSHMRRWRPRAMGRATRIQKGVSHIHIELDAR
jgi:large subunit ribosomal protein L22